MPLAFPAAFKPCILLRRIRVGAETDRHSGTNLQLVLPLLERQVAENDGPDEHTEKADQKEVLGLLKCSVSVSVICAHPQIMQQTQQGCLAPKTPDLPQENNLPAVIGCW